MAKRETALGSRTVIRVGTISLKFTIRNSSNESISVLCACLGGHGAFPVHIFEYGQDFSRMKPSRFLVSALLSCALQSAFAQTCPMPDDVLGHSMDDAKRAMSKAIGTNWFSNDVGCTDVYVNLMSDWEHGDCKIPGSSSAARISVWGNDGSGTVVGMFYLLRTRMPESDVKRLFSRGELKRVDDYPMPLRSLFPVPSNDAVFVSADEERVLRIGSEPGNADTQVVQLYDLRAVRKEIASLRVCARETRTLRRDSAQP